MQSPLDPSVTRTASKTQSHLPFPYHSHKSEELRDVLWRVRATHSIGLSAGFILKPVFHAQFRSSSGESCEERSILPAAMIQSWYTIPVRECR